MERLDWLVIVRVRADCRRRYRRVCSCRVPVTVTVTAPGPPKAIGKGLFSHGFLAMLFTERYVAGRSMNSLVTGLARQGADISPATLAGTCAVRRIRERLASDVRALRGANAEAVVIKLNPIIKGWARSAPEWLHRS